VDRFRQGCCQALFSWTNADYAEKAYWWRSTASLRLGLTFPVVGRDVVEMVIHGGLRREWVASGNCLEDPGMGLVDFFR
jgi:hypothetical protein